MIFWSDERAFNCGIVSANPGGSKLPTAKHPVMLARLVGVEANQASLEEMGGGPVHPHRRRCSRTNYSRVGQAFTEASASKPKNCQWRQFVHVGFAQIK